MKKDEIVIRGYAIFVELEDDILILSSRSDQNKNLLHLYLQKLKEAKVEEVFMFWDNNINHFLNFVINSFMVECDQLVLDLIYSAYILKIEKKDGKIEIQ